MRPGKRSRAAKDREEFKKRRIDSPTRTSEGSCYAPSELECDSDEAIEVKEASADEHARSAGAREALRALLVSETGDLSDSDGEIMLDMGDTLDENDWDPQMVPDLYPIFTSLVSNCSLAQKTLHTNYLRFLAESVIQSGGKIHACTGIYGQKSNEWMAPASFSGQASKRGRDMW